MRARRRWSTLLAAALLVVGIVGVGTAVDATQSAWTDKTYASAVATGGTWVTPDTVGCKAMNANGTAKAGGYCSVTSVSVQAEWGTAGDRTRNYSVTFNSNAAEGYIQFTVDLSVSGGAFTWTNAGLVAPTQQVTPTNGWTCAKLPILTGKTPTNWGWGASSSIYFQVTENRSSTAVTCS